MQLQGNTIAAADAEPQACEILTSDLRVMNYLVKLDRVRLGSIELNGVDGVVGEQDMPFILLGMSFLNRLEMLRDGASMTLTRRF